MNNEKENILYVLVICGCTVEKSEAFSTLIEPHVDDIGNTFVYDNSPQIQNTKYKVAAYVHDTNNSGLGKAYNEACKFAVEHGYKWLLLMDQDTIFPDGSLAYYKAAAASIQTDMIVPRHKVKNDMYVSPTPYRMKTSNLHKQSPTGFVYFKDCAPINSGMMLTVDSFRKAGGYEESVWLDFSDICFIEKYKNHYKSFYVMPEVTCLQSFSGLDYDPVKIYKRFCIYLECARNFPKTTMSDAISLLITTLRPTLSRTFKEHTMKYIKAYWSIYVSGKKWNYYENRK